MKNMLLDQIFQNTDSIIPQNLEPIKVQFVDPKDFSYDRDAKNRFYISLSNIAFSLDKKVAVVFINLISSMSSGGEKLVILRKEYDQWRIISFKEISVC